MPLDGRILVEDSTYSLIATSVAPGNLKSMLSIQNASGSIVRVELDKLFIKSAQTSSVTGVMVTLEWRRCTSHASGTDLTADVQRFDTSDDALSSSVTVRTGATITGETGVIDRWVWSTDERGTGTLDQEGHDYPLQSLIPCYQSVANSRPFTLRANEAMTIKCATNTTIGAFDIFCQWRVL